MLEGKMLRCAAASLFAHPLTLLRIRKEPIDRLRQRTLISWRYQQSCFSINYDFGDAADASRDYRDAAGHWLQRRQSKCLLPDRRNDTHIGARGQTARIGSVPRQDDAIALTQPRVNTLQSIVVRT